MKTHINQIFTVVSFFSLSLTTTLAISWGINGFAGNDTTGKIHCSEKTSAIVKVIKSKQCNVKSTDALKFLTPKIKFRSNG